MNHQRPRKRLAAIALALSFTACSAPDAAYVAADAATFDAVAPVYLSYVDADQRLTTEDRARKQRLIQTWKMRIDAAKEKK